MNKRAIFILVLIIVFCIFFYIVFNFQRDSVQNEIIRNDMIFDENKDEEQGNKTVETVSQDSKTTPNTMLVLKKYYTNCGHVISDSAIMPEEMVNLTEEEIKEKYTNWDVEEFSEDEVVLARTLESFCGEHYYVTEEDNYISIYIIDENGSKTLKENDKISCEYLPETDRINLKNGIIVYGTEELNKLLESFEA